MEELERTIHRLAKEQDAVIICIPMQFPEDEEAAEAMGKGDEGVYFLNEDFSIEELMSIIGNMDVLLGMRLHALIFLLSCMCLFLVFPMIPK